MDGDSGEHDGEHREADVADREGHGAEAAQDGKSGGDVGGAEEDPREADEVKGDEDADVAAPSGCGAFALNLLAEGLEGAEEGEADTVEEPPEDEGPADAVPEAAKEKDDDGIDVTSTLPASGVGKREIDIVAEPVGEGDVPATPEVGEVDRLVGAVEVVGDSQTEEKAESHRDVGVAGEVKVDLEGVGVDADEDFGSAVEGGGVEDAVGDIVGEEVGDEELLHEAGGDEEEGSTTLGLSQGEGLLELSNKVGDSVDRTGDDNREERGGGEVSKVAACPRPGSPIEVNRVSH